MRKVYISGALTNAKRGEDLRHFYEAIASLCAQLGYVPYVPHLHTDPITNADLSPREVYDKDRKEISMSVLVVAYVGEPSFGVGQEVELANTLGVPVVILYEREKRISRMLRGNPAIVGEIAFGDFSDGLEQVRQWFSEFDRQSRSGIQCKEERNGD